MKLIVGLGNPGKRYERTRHNVGFMILDELHKILKNECEINDWELSKKFNAETAGYSNNGDKIILLKPMTFMNESGQSVGLVAKYYKMISHDIIVVHDDKDLPLGEIKIQSDRGAAGHNGIKSIIQTMGTKSFVRVRVGVASKNEKKYGK